MKARKIISAYAFVDETTKEEFAFHVVHFPNMPARIVIDINNGAEDGYGNPITKSLAFDLSDYQAKEIATVLSSEE